MVYPVLHYVGHGIPHGRAGIVQLAHIAVERMQIARIIVGMQVEPRVVVCRVVGHPVEPYLHIQAVCRVHQVSQIVDSAVARVRSLHGCRCIRTVHSAVALVYRHKPHHVYTKVFQRAELAGSSIERTGRGERTHIHLIDHTMAEAIFLACGVDVTDEVGSRNCRTAHQQQH